MYYYVPNRKDSSPTAPPGIPQEAADRCLGVLAGCVCSTVGLIINIIIERDIENTESGVVRRGGSEMR